MIDSKFISDLFGFGSVTIEHICTQTNKLYRLKCDKAKTYSVKVFNHQTHLLAMRQQTLRCLRSIKAYNYLRPVSSLRGAILNSLPTGELFLIQEWVPGIRLSDCLDRDNVIAAGRAASEMHSLLQRVADSSAYNALRHWNSLFYWNDFCSVALGRVLSEPWRYDVIERVDRFLMNLSPIQLIHGDLNSHNVLIHDGTAKYIDFDDLMWGTLEQDICIFLFDYRDDPLLNLYTEWFLKGYHSAGSIRISLSKDFCDIMFFARTLSLVNSELNSNSYSARIGELLHRFEIVNSILKFHEFSR